MELDINRIAVARDGRRYKLLCLDRPGAMPVLGFNLDGGDLMAWYSSGKHFKDDSSASDIIRQEPLDTPQAPRPKIDIKKPVKLRGGCEVVLLSDKGVSPGRPLVGQWKNSDGVWSAPCTWMPDGRFVSADENVNLDIIQEKEVWLAVRSNGMVGVFQDKRAAATVACPRAIIRVPYVDGQFD